MDKNVLYFIYSGHWQKREKKLNVIIWGYKCDCWWTKLIKKKSQCKKDNFFILCKIQVRLIVIFTVIF